VNSDGRVYVATPAGPVEGGPPGGGFALPRAERLRLEILGAIAEDRGATQRRLSARLGIALGLTNALVRRLARKGYIKITHVSPRRVRYLVTPKGILEKSRLTYFYIEFSIRYYRDLRARIQALFGALVEAGVRRILLYGAGEVAEIALVCMHGTSLELVAIVDERGAGQTILGRRVDGLERLGSAPVDAVVVTAPVPPERLAERLAGLGVPREKIWGLDGARQPTAARARRAPRGAMPRAGGSPGSRREARAEPAP
jgi:DNA-binding MarR family transcriptional regulator